MIVVDSSVWIANLRGSDAIGVRTLQTVAKQAGRLLIGDLVMLEVLQGARTARHAADLERALRQFPIVSMLDDRIAVRASENFRTLRALGVTVRKTANLIIATFCIAHDHALLHDDRDFVPMAKHLGLRVI